MDHFFLFVGQEEKTKEESIVGWSDIHNACTRLVIVLLSSRDVVPPLLSIHTPHEDEHRYRTGAASGGKL